MHLILGYYDADNKQNSKTGHQENDSHPGQNGTDGGLLIFDGAVTEWCVVVLNYSQAGLLELGSRVDTGAMARYCPKLEQRIKSQKDAA